MWLKTMNMIFPIVDLIVPESSSSELNSLGQIDIDGVWIWEVRKRSGLRYIFQA